MPQAIRAKGTLVSATDATYPPYEYVKAGSHTVIGVDPDMLAAIGTELNLKITVVNASFDTIIPGLTSGKYDLSASSFIDTPERQQQVDFATYFHGASTLYVKSGSSTHYTGIDTSLCGVKVAVENGTVEQTELQDQATRCTKAGKPALTILTFGDQNTVNLAVSSGRADAGFADGGVISYLIQQTNGQFSTTGKSVPNATQWGIALPKGNGMAQAVQAAINAMIADGSYLKILKKWGVQGGAVQKSQVNVATS